MSTTRSALGLAALVVVGGMVAARADDKPAPGKDGKYALVARYEKGELIAVEGSFTLDLGINLQVAERGINRNTRELQASGHRVLDRILEVKDGTPLKVRRRYVESWQAIQEPGAREPVRSATPLDRRTLEVFVDPKGRTVARVPEGATPLPEGAALGERLTERWEGALPKEGSVAVGATWKVKGAALGKLFGAALGEKPEGELEMKLDAVKEEPLAKGAKPEPIAIVGLKLVAKRENADDEGLKLEARLQGALKFALDRGKIVAVDLTGEASVDEERGDPKAGPTMVIRGRGPLEVHKRTTFPKEEPKEPPGGR